MAHHTSLSLDLLAIHVFPKVLTLRDCHVGIEGEDDAAAGRDPEALM